MTTSSAQQTYSITLNDTASDTVGFFAQEISTVIPNVIMSAPAATYTYSVGSGSSGTISITDLSSEHEVSWGNKEWVDCFPEWARIQKMCDEYPGLKIAFEKFKTTYDLVKDDYDTPKDKRKIP